MGHDKSEPTRDILGDALLCRNHTKEKLKKLEDRARDIARRLEALAGIVAEKRKGMRNSDTTQGGFLVYPDNRPEPVHVPCPTEKEILDLLTERDQLRSNLEQAEEILRPYLK